MRMTMPSMAEYFKVNRYQPKYEFGTRVIGKWNKIPFVGTIYGDSVVSELEGPRYTIHLDLPLKYDGKYHTILVVKHNDVKLSLYK